MFWPQAVSHLRDQSDFAEHLRAYEVAYGKSATLPLEPLWYPEMDTQRPHLSEVLEERGFESYEALHRWSVEARADFWHYTIFERLGLPFYEGPRQILAFSSGSVAQPTWLEGARLNIIEAIERWPAQAEALLEYREAGLSQHFTYESLKVWIRRAAGAYQGLGLKPGDVIAICMPLRWEAAVLYLGAVWAGLVVATIPDSLSGEEMAARLAIAKPQVLFIQDVISREGKVVPLYERLSGHTLPKTFVLPAEALLSVRLRNQTYPISAFWERETVHTAAYPAEPSDLMGILFSSGTTAQPKAIPWTHLTAIKAVADGYYYHDLRSGARVTWPTNLGWMMGPWLLLAGLANGATVCLYPYAPTTPAFCRFVQEAGITVLGVVPSLVRRWIETAAWQSTDWSQIRLFSSTGEASNPWHMWRLMAQAGYKPIIEYCGGTEIGGGYITSTLLHPNAPSQFSAPALGLDFVVLNEVGQPESEGELFLVPPSIGLSEQLLNASHEAVYYAHTPSIGEGWLGATGAPIPQEIAGVGMRLRRHGDYMRRLGNGYWVSGGRADDAMNLGGIKVSAAEIERIVMQVPGISEVAAIAVPPQEGGPDSLVLYLVLVAGEKVDPAHWKTLANSAIRQKLSPLFHVAEVVIVSELPRTASNKVMRRLLRNDYVAARSNTT